MPTPQNCGALLGRFCAPSGQGLMCRRNRATRLLGPAICDLSQFFARCWIVDRKGLARISRRPAAVDERVGAQER